MEIVILYISVSLIYIFLVCLDGEDVKPKWKQWLADKLGIKPKIEVRYIKPQLLSFVQELKCHTLKCNTIAVTNLAWSN